MRGFLHHLATSILWCNGSQNVVPGPATSAPPGHLLEMQTLRLHSRPTKSQTLGVKSGDLFEQVLQVVPAHRRVGESLGEHTGFKGPPNQPILKKINPEYSLEGLVLKLKPQYSGHLMLRANSLEKTLRVGKTKGKRRRGQQRMRWLDSITDSMDVSLNKLSKIVYSSEIIPRRTEEPDVQQSMG